MKKKKTVISIILSFLISSVLLLGISFAFLSANKTDLSADVKDYSVPYKALPENSGLLFSFPDGNGLLIYLDFSSDSSAAVLLNNTDFEEKEIYGYKIDYHFSLNYDTIQYIIDSASGVVLDINGERLRLTGSQIVEILSENPDNFDLLREVLPQVLEGISKNGLKKSDFIYIIENSETSLKITDCFNWPDYIESLFENVNIIS
jgi:hypothetical protein